MDFIIKFIKNQKNNQNFYKNRESQKNKWMWNSIRNSVNEFISKDITKEKFVLQIQEKVQNKNLSIFKASQLILDFFIKK